MAPPARMLVAVAPHPGRVASEIAMLRRVASVACRWLQHGTESLQRLLADRVPAPELFAPVGTRRYRPLERVILSEDVHKTLFDDYTTHRRGDRGGEEIGWVLLGLREEAEVLVLATLPAGADRQAGVAHVRFNSDAQALGARIVRQTDRRLGMVGVVHTHPGSLRHPSDGDYQGDILWVSQLRGGEGVFGIGTADADGTKTPPHRLEARGLGFSWYALGSGDEHYRRLPVDVLPGPDLARPLQPFWPVLEAHAEALDTIYRQLARVSIEVASGNLTCKIPLSSDRTLAVRLRQTEVEYHLEELGRQTPLECPETDLVRAIYLLLADLAHEKQPQRESGLVRA